MIVRLASLVQDLNRWVDLATFDVVVNLEGSEPSFHARIRVPDSRETDITRFCKSFGIQNVVVSPHSTGWVEITFPVSVMESRR